MADERDPKVSQRYRELGAEEPPRALDDAILAASRKELARKRNWYAPVALAATLVLVVAVAVQVERRRPVEDTVASAPVQAQKQPEPPRELLKERQTEQPAPAAKPAAPPPAASNRGFTPEPPPAATADSAVRRDAPRAAEAPRQEAATDELRRKQAEVQPSLPERKADGAAAAPQAAPAAAPPVAGARAPVQERAGVLASKAELSPDRWLEQIAELRKQGKHEEADKSLAEFRQRYPDYRMSDELKAKVERK